jgi:hypothetical protein
MAVQPLAAPRWLRDSSNNAKPPFEGGPEASWLVEDAAQTYKPGALLYIDTSTGKLKIATASTALALQAVTAASGAEDTGVHGKILRPEDRWLVNVYHSTPASAVTTLDLLTKRFRIAIVNGFAHVDIENTTVEDGTNALARVKVVGFVPELSAIGDRYGLVVARFVNRSIATDGAPHTEVLQLA